jgi:hypothetical protein
MRTVFAISILFSYQVCWAQGPTSPRQDIPVDGQSQRRVQQEAFERWALDSDGRKKEETSKSEEAAQEFYSKARHFVDLWQAFAEELNDKKTFNAKLAKQVSKAFHEMEKSDGWPVGRPK